MEITNIRWYASTEDTRWEEMQINADAAGEAILAFTDERFQRLEGFGGCFNELGYVALGAGSRTRC
ncbi:hypothetical protein KP806_06950 [Paenibacillus sp. N4]|uniref:hypothetical protein n=1 Tax=Paenibacillus vietnamensis TaxID=2590547 RepID=UPI001CD06E75|nr:hypothetical protein [Paenibacillus vietnamensis]MCA0754784.1 hypothetical protein [Paenibacillus vietnamensis]